MTHVLDLIGDGSTVHAKFDSVVDRDAAKDCAFDIRQLIELDDKRYRFLIDFSKSFGISDSARHFLFDMLKHISENTERMAVVAPPKLTQTLSAIFENAGGLKDVRLFEQTEEAIKWLWE